MPESPLTGATGKLLFEHKVIGRHPASYFLDESCGFVWVDNPTWLDEAYSDAIAVTDTGVMVRHNLNISRVSYAMWANEMAGLPAIDLGGGYGLLVRGLRDLGLDFYWTDLYAQNLVARGFEAAPDQRFGVATAFEVLEHLENPLAFLKDARSTYAFDTLFFSATCLDPNNIPDTDWWYWAFETGQHISFFSEQTLDHIADELGMYKTGVKGDMYAFSVRRDLKWPRGIERYQLTRKYRRASLAQGDYEAMKRYVSAHQSSNDGRR